MEQTARQSAIAFYRDIAGGRARMARHWKLQARKRENPGPGTKFQENKSLQNFV
jgi:hypothetical protein